MKIKEIFKSKNAKRIEILEEMITLSDRNNKRLKNENKKYTVANDELEKRIATITDDSINKINKLIKENQNLKVKLRINGSSKGGLIKQINKLTNLNLEYKNEIEVLKSDRYLIKKLPPCKVPKTNTIKSKKSTQHGQVSKQLSELNSIRYDSASL